MNLYLQNLVEESEKKLKKLISDSDWHNKRVKELELEIIELQEAIAELKGL